ncbi:MAG TPA: nuclear transport factor 2 family protein [Myxococcota bacterium]|nr:nuclear transport factor 2 family protein [Myxococcota bacterium]
MDVSADRAFFDALVASDGTGLDRILANDFAIVDVAGGAVTRKADFARLIASRGVVFDSIETVPDQALVRFYEGVGVVIGSTSMRLVLDSGPLSVRSRYTHVFVKDQDGGWQLVSAQGTPIVG